MSTSLGTSTNSLIEYAAKLDGSASKLTQISGNQTREMDLVDEIEQFGKEDYFAKKELRNRLRSAEERIHNLEDILTRQTQKSNPTIVSSSTSSPSDITISSSYTTSSPTFTSSSTIPTSSTSPSLTVSQSTTASSKATSSPSATISSSSSPLSFTSSPSTTKSSASARFTTLSTNASSSTSPSTPSLSSSKSSKIPKPDITSTDETSETHISILESSPLTRRIANDSSQSISTGSPTRMSSFRNQTSDFSFTTDGTTSSFSPSTSFSQSFSTSKTSSSSVKTPSSGSILGTSHTLSHSSIATNTVKSHKHRKNHKQKHSRREKPVVALETRDSYDYTHDSLSDTSYSSNSSYSSSFSLSKSSSSSEYSSFSNGSSDSLDISLTKERYNRPVRIEKSYHYSPYSEKSSKRCFCDCEKRRYKNILEDDKFDHLIECLKNQNQKTCPPECTSEIIRDLERFTAEKFSEMDHIICNIQSRNEKARVKILEKENYRLKKNLHKIKGIIHIIKNQKANQKIDELFGGISEKELLQHIAVEFHDFLGSNEDISRETAMKLVTRVSKAFIKHEN